MVKKMRKYEIVIVDGFKFKVAKVDGYRVKIKHPLLRDSQLAVTIVKDNKPECRYTVTELEVGSCYGFGATPKEAIKSLRKKLNSVSQTKFVEVIFNTKEKFESYGIFLNNVKKEKYVAPYQLPICFEGEVK